MSLIKSKSWNSTLPLLACGVAILGTHGYISPVKAEAIPDKVAAIVENYCLDCHSENEPEAGINLDVLTIGWDRTTEISQWEKVFEVIKHAEMPPSDKPQPSKEARKMLEKWLESRLVQHSKVGGTSPRRLNRQEYTQTIRQVFNIQDFEVPESFPPDNSHGGFDNNGMGLILSPPLMAQYLQLANSIADEVIPSLSKKPVADPKKYQIEGKHFTTGMGSGGAYEMDHDVFRLVSSRNMASAGAWPERFEARESGIYQITINTKVFDTGDGYYKVGIDGAPVKVALYARQNTEDLYASYGDIRKLGEFDIPAEIGTKQTISLKAELFKGEVFGVRWVNGPVTSDFPKRDLSHKFLGGRLANDRILYAALNEYQGGPRGVTQPEFYEDVRKIIERGDLDLTQGFLDTLPEKYGGGIGNSWHNWVKAYAHEEMHRFGPALDVIEAEVNGPIQLIEDEETRERLARRSSFLGTRDKGESLEAYVRGVIENQFMPIFRRPLTDDEIDEYSELAMLQVEENNPESIATGLHLALRRGLISPHFLYRSLNPGQLDNFSLASRLSYFLTSGPPDEKLMKLALEGRLTHPEVLRTETRRLIRSEESVHFVHAFSDQWLGTRELINIMPDPRLLPFFDSNRLAMTDEARLLFNEVLQENLPVLDFLDPGFSYRNVNLNKIYGGELNGVQMRKITFAKGGKEGGILSLGAVMMATANGVDTNPIHRGVWLLENVFGTPTPSPPSNVPAIAPDTTGTTNIRDQLEAHQRDPACSRCHAQIDPLGMVLENFDPVGRWRTHYPVYSKKEEQPEPLKEDFYKNLGKGTHYGPKVYAGSTLEDGTALNDISDLKQYLMKRPHIFTSCLTEKLMTYATGRDLNFADRRVVESIVEKSIQSGGGFQDLIEEVILSDSFLTR